MWNIFSLVAFFTLKVNNHLRLSFLWDIYAEIILWQHLEWEWIIVDAVFDDISILWNIVRVKSVYSKSDKDRTLLTYHDLKFYVTIVTSKVQIYYIEIEVFTFT